MASPTARHTESQHHLLFGRRLGTGPSAEYQAQIAIQRQIGRLPGLLAEDQWEAALELIAAVPISQQAQGWLRLAVWLEEEQQLPGGSTAISNELAACAAQQLDLRPRLWGLPVATLLLGTGAMSASLVEQLIWTVSRRFSSRETALRYDPAWEGIAAACQLGPSAPLDQLLLTLINAPAWTEPGYVRNLFDWAAGRDPHVVYARGPKLLHLVTDEQTVCGKPAESFSLYAERGAYYLTKRGRWLAMPDGCNQYRCCSSCQQRQPAHPSSSSCYRVQELSAVAREQISQRSVDLARAELAKPHWRAYDVRKVSKRATDEALISVVVDELLAQPLAERWQCILGPEQYRVAELVGPFPELGRADLSKLARLRNQYALTKKSQIRSERQAAALHRRLVNNVRAEQGQPLWERGRVKGKVSSEAHEFIFTATESGRYVAQPRCQGEVLWDRRRTLNHPPDVPRCADCQAASQLVG